MPHASLEEALLLGSGVERSYLCEYHPDHNASASVNSITGLWCCYACGAAGKVGLDKLTFDSDGIVKYTKQLFEEMARERYYPESWLNMFDSIGPGDYWTSRFDERVCRDFRLGQAPHVATYPMRDDSGCVLGIVTRDLTGEREAKYMYPYRVRVSDHLANFYRARSDNLILVEGMADVVACAEVGYTAVGSYHAGISSAQVGLLKKYQPKTLYVAYDQDEAGEKGFSKVMDKLSPYFNVQRLWWDSYNDVAEMPAWERREMFFQVITSKALART